MISNFKIEHNSSEDQCSFFDYLEHLMVVVKDKGSYKRRISEAIRSRKEDRTYLDFDRFQGCQCLQTII